MFSCADLHLTILEEDFRMVQGNPPSHLPWCHFRHLRSSAERRNRKNVADHLHPSLSASYHVPGVAPPLLLPLDRIQNVKRPEWTTQCRGIGAVGVRGVADVRCLRGDLPLAQ